MRVLVHRLARRGQAHARARAVGDCRAADHGTTYTLHPTPFALHLTPYTLHLSLHTRHLTPYTLHTKPQIGVADHWWVMRRALRDSHAADRFAMLNAPRAGLHSTPYTLHPASCTPDAPALSPYTLHLTPYTPHPTPHTLRLTPYASHPTPHILHLTPYASHPTPHTPHLTAGSGACGRSSCGWRDRASLPSPSPATSNTD